MLMLRFLLRKMWNNRWLTISVLLGLMASAAFTSSIPMYADGAVQRLLAGELAKAEGGVPPGVLLIRQQNGSSSVSRAAEIEAMDAYIGEELPVQLDVPFSRYVRTIAFRSGRLEPLDPETNVGRVRQLSLAAQDGLEQYAELADGRWPSGASPSGAVEAVVTEDALSRFDMRIGDQYTYMLPTAGGNRQITVELVGAFRAVDEKDEYWYQGFDHMALYLWADEAFVREELLAGLGAVHATATWFYSLQLESATGSSLTRLNRTLGRLDLNLQRIMEGARGDISPLPFVQRFRADSQRLEGMMFMLAAPMLGMVLYFVGMTARQAMERQRGDVAVLRSRGASSGQIFGVFAAESALLGIAALASGLGLGWLLARLIGSANGFLTFEYGREAEVMLSVKAAVYGALAVLAGWLASVLPALAAAKASIVDHKRSQARLERPPLWQRLYLDAVLVLIAAYGWYALQERELLLGRTGLTGDQVQVQPMLFFIPAVAIIAAGLLCLRFFAPCLKLIHRLIGRLLPLALHLTLTQMSRSFVSYYPLMLLLIVTMGLGTYHASAARTMDLNAEERMYYRNGADVVLNAVWEGYEPEDEEGSRQEGEFGTIVYTEPPFTPFRQLVGVSASARVLRTQANAQLSGRNAGRGELMGLDNVDFAEAARFRPDLYPAAHPHWYLKLLGAYEHAVLVSEPFARANRLQPGDPIVLRVDQTAIEFVVVGIVPYWPGLDPNRAPFFVANLDYLYDRLPIMPYEVWFRMEDGAKVNPLIRQLADSSIYTAWVRDVRNEILLQQAHPSRNGVFGTLSLGFIVSVSISLLGYVIYWYFQLRGRVVQLGILRAMGLSRLQLNVMLFAEQVLSAGSAILLGLLLGRGAGGLFLPFLEEGEGNRLLPLQVVFELQDLLQLLAAVAVMVLTGGLLMIRMVQTLRVNQAIKMGEER